MVAKHNFRDHALCRTFLSQFENFLRGYFKALKGLPFKGHKALQDSINHTLFTGGKYFRPLLTLTTARWAHIPLQVVLPWAGALEIAHSASLIHDDLPCMDNSPMRRGQPANHRLFGEDIALLAGNSLWVEAFRIIITKAEKAKAGPWLRLLSDTLGFNGLMGGQALDLKIPLEPDEDYYKQMHLMKTGKLISASMVGVAILPSVEKEKKQAIQNISPLIGQAFQIADDLQDEKTQVESSNFAVAVGRTKAQALLIELSDKALAELMPTNGSDPNSAEELLREMIIFNKNRA